MPDWGSRTLGGRVDRALAACKVDARTLRRPNLPMFPCFCADTTETGADGFQRRHQERKLRMLRFWRDGLERQLAAIDAAISTLQRQMERDGSMPQGGQG